MSIAVTGGTGFVGTVLVNKLKQRNVRLIQRRKVELISSIHSCHLHEISSSTQFGDCLKSCDVVIHSAALVHVMTDSVSKPLEAYREVNTLGTANLARQAALSGVKRFIFISSIKVNGEKTCTNNQFTSADEHAPEDDYGLSKSKAEQHLFDIGKKTGMEIVVIRPTLVYGPGVKANFSSLMNLVSKGIPLPFGCITKNKRSLVSVDNLVDLIVTCIDHPKAANQVFLVSDDRDVSTSEMVREMAIALGKTTWQLPVPIWCYKLIGKLFNKSDIVDRLIGSLQVDISHTKNTLGWKPPQTLQDGFKQTAQAFLQANRK
ncbi:MAG: UDP-glucose 4-epimerase family protein [Plesiomonas shigelloides]|nr:SDR family oxidoreductase [Plesiomonas shigelloides]